MTSRPEWHTYSKVGLWAFDKPSRMAQARPGDQAVVYLTKAGWGYSSFGGVVEFKAEATEYAPDRDDVSERFRHLVPVTVMECLQAPVPLKRVKSRLAFLPDGPHWSTVLQGRPILPISSADFDLILAEVQRTAAIEAASV